MASPCAQCPQATRSKRNRSRVDMEDNAHSRFQPRGRCSPSAGALGTRWFISRTKCCKQRTQHPSITPHRDEARLEVRQACAPRSFRSRSERLSREVPDEASLSAEGGGLVAFPRGPGVLRRCRQHPLTSSRNSRCTARRVDRRCRAGLSEARSRLQLPGAVLSLRDIQRSL